MLEKFTKKTPILIASVIGACAICCIPLIAPLVVGLTGAGLFGVGYWFIGAAFVAVAGIYVVFKSRAARSCEPFRNRDCCAPE